MFSPSERALGIMLAQIGKHLKIENGIDYAAVEDALSSGDDWSLSMDGSGLLSGDEKLPTDVEETCNILDMWRVVRIGVSALTEAEKAVLLSELELKDVPEFEGFDGNNDIHYHHAYRLKKIGRYEELDNLPLNSHSSVTLAVYRSMYSRYKHIDRPLTGPISLEQLVTILRSP